MTVAPDAEACEPMVLAMAARYGGRADRNGGDDLLQECRIGAVRAVRSYAPDRGPFKLWLGICTRSAARNWRAYCDVRRKTKSGVPGGLRAPDEVEATDARLDVAELWGRLTPTQQRVLYGLHWEGRTVRDLGGAAWQTAQAAYRRLRPYLEGSDQ